MNKQIKVITDADVIHQIKREFGPLGIMYEDDYVMLIKEPVQFPNGALGTYIKFVEPPTSKKGCAILPITQDNKIVLVNHYRFAIQDYQLEIPRGFGTDGITIEANAIKELQEELNASINTLQFLGSVFPDTGLFEKEVYIYLARIAVDYNNPLAIHDGREAIDSFREVSLTQLKDMVTHGIIKDSFTLTALSLALLRNEI